MTEVQTPQADSSYGESGIVVLEGLEAVRRRPGMYIGDTTVRGLHHCVYEIVDNSVDEALAGHCGHITVTIGTDESVSVTDDGRGIPVEIHHQTGKSTVETVLTVLHAGGKFDNRSYKVSGGLHGVGVSVVNALSEWLEVTVWRDGYEYFQRYERGIPVAPLAKTLPSTRRGTRVRFLADSQIFDEVQYSAETLVSRFREMAFLIPGLTITVEDQREGKTWTFCEEGGIAEFVRYLNRDRVVLFPEPLVVSGERDGVSVEMAFQYTDDYNERLFSFANLIHTVEGGTHVAGGPAPCARRTKTSPARTCAKD